VSAQAQPKDYAAAIYDLALETWSQQLDSVQRVLEDDAALRSALDDHNRSTYDKLMLLQQTVPGGLSTDARKFLGTLIDNEQLGQIEAILIEFRRLMRHRPELKSAQVTTAVPLTESEKHGLQALLIKRFGAEIEIEFRVDPAVIGGVHLRVGDQVIDGSIAGKLAALRDRLAA
jgi:F-type H+-transporting ATPase subunit delta